MAQTLLRLGGLQLNISGTWTLVCGLAARTNAALTAIHCYNIRAGYRDYRLVFDAYNLSDTSQATITFVSGRVVALRINTNGPGYTYNNIKLRTDFAVTANPPPPLGDPIDNPGLECDVFGWGKLADGTYPDVLQRRKVTLISRADCQTRVSPLGAIINSGDICVDGDVISEGDGGNPLRCNGMIVGVASWTAAGEGCERPISIFTGSPDFFG